jgi:hypothetical protein
MDPLLRKNQAHMLYHVLQRPRPPTGQAGGGSRTVYITGGPCTSCTRPRTDLHRYLDLAVHLAGALAVHPGGEDLTPHAAFMGMAPAFREWGDRAPGARYGACCARDIVGPRQQVLHDAAGGPGLGSKMGALALHPPSGAGSGGAYPPVILGGAFTLDDVARDLA